MKEKAEYHKMGMRSTKDGYVGGGQSDTKSHMSAVTAGSRVTTSDNAYLYAAGDQQKIEDINKKLLGYNPSISDFLTANDNYDKEAQFLPSNKREKFENKKENLGRDKFDTQSVASLQSNVSNYSRKSGLSLLDMGSILSLGSNSKTSQIMPGIKSLRDNAHKR